MKSYIVYHYFTPEKGQEWLNTVFDKDIPVFDYVTPDRADAIQKSFDLGGLDAGYYVAEVGETACF